MSKPTTKRSGEIEAAKIEAAKIEVAKIEVARKTAAEIEEFNRKKVEEERLLAAQQEGSLIEPKEELSVVDSEKEHVYNAQVVGDDAYLLLADYKKQFNKDPISKPDGSHVFEFESKEQAATFFGEQAGAKRKFLCMEEGKGVDGHNFFSCGDGKLYQGSIREIMAELQKTSSAEPSNLLVQEGLKYLSSHFSSSTPSQEFRGAVQDIKPGAKDLNSEANQNRLSNR